MHSKRIATFFKYLFLSLSILVALVLIGINLPAGNRIITETANNIFREKNIPVQVKKIEFLINGKVGLDQVKIVRNEDDTLVYAGQARVSVRVLPLVLRKVMVKNVTLNDATIYLNSDSLTGTIDLLSLFVTAERPPEPKTKSGKKWDIGVNSVNLKNIRFVYNDDFRGIRIGQYVEALSVKVDRFSLSSRQIYADFIEMEKAHGELTLSTASKPENPGKKPGTSWAFRLRRSDLKDIHFILHQPDAESRMEFSLAGGDISGAEVDLTNSRISVNNIMLDEPGVFARSSPQENVREAQDKKSPEQGFPGSWNIAGNKIAMTNGSFHTGVYNNASSGLTAEGSFQVATLDVTLKDLMLSGDEAGFRMDRLSFALENGFQLENGEIDFSSGSDLKSYLKAKLRTASSRLNLNIEIGTKLSALAKSFASAPFSMTIDDAFISAIDLRAFIPAPEGKAPGKSPGKAVKQQGLGINCNISGTPDLLDISQFTVKTPSGSGIVLAGRISNLTKPLLSVCSIDFRTENLTHTRLTELLMLTGAAVNLPEFEPLTISGNISDSLFSPSLSLTLLSNTGNIAAEGSMDIRDKDYTITMTYSGLELGKFAGIKDMDRISGSLNAAGKGFSIDSLNISASVTVDTARYRGYDYHAITVSVDGTAGLYSFAVDAADASLKCSLEGVADLKDQMLSGRVSGMFDLDAGILNLIKGVSVSGALEAEAAKSSGGINASAALKKISLTRFNRTEYLDSLILALNSSDSILSGEIEGDFLKAAFYFGGSGNDLKSALKEGRFRGIAAVDSAVANSIPYISALPELNVSLESTYDPFIGLIVSDTIFSFSKVAMNIVKDSTGTAKGDISVDRFSFMKSQGYAAAIRFVSLPDRSVLAVRADSVRYGNVALTDPVIDMTSAGDTVRYSIQARDRSELLLYDIAGIAYKNEKLIRLRTSQPEWTVNGFRWTVAQGDFLVLDPAKRSFRTDLHWKNGGSSIDIVGSELEKIFIEVRNVWINMLAIPGMNTFGYDGELTGRVDYSRRNGNELGVKMDIMQTKMYESPLGDFRIMASYLSDTIGTVEGDLNAVLNDTSSLNLVFRSEKKGDQKSMQSEFSGIPLNTFESLVSKYISGLTGEVSGDLRLSSTGKKPVLDGEIQITGTELKIIPLNARFYLPDEVIILEDNRIIFRQFKVLDSLKKQLTLNGSVNLDNPENITADIQVTSDRLQVMNTTEKDNPSFNGSVFVNTRLNITGPVQSPSIAGSIALAEGTVINYTLTENLTVSETEKTITFASLADEDQEGESEEAPVQSFSRTPDIEAAIEINPNSLFNFSISRGFDIGAQIRGGGFLTYGLMPNKDISLSGTYEINQGDAELKIPGWPRKNFTITPGSYLRWDGPVDNPELNVETISKVRGSYSNPVDGQTREVDFLVNMKLADRLSQLKIIFDVSSQDQYITSVFNSFSTDERMRQAINLLIFERIELPGQTSSTDYLTQQINQFWESQISQITKSAFKNVDVSLGIDTYTQATEQGEQEVTSFSYEVKKAMFRDRGTVMVSGRMNDNSPGSTQTSNLIENFIFEYALDTNRTKFIKVYRQQNYEDLLEGEVTKSGLGFIYRKSYDRISDIWRRKRKSKAIGNRGASEK
jgi:autotransporter translocation and assembly factor TamB